MHRYSVRPSDERAAGMLADACDLGPAAAQVLLHRGIETPDEASSFLEASLRGLSSPEPMADRAASADRIASAIRRNERIVVFGDYDVDGTTSAIILSEVITALGGEVRTLIADRFAGGYGLSDEALQRCLDGAPGLLVTCDCGSSDHPRIERAHAAGVDVIVVDHHLVPDDPLPALAFLNPHRPDCGFSFKGLCSAGLAFSLGAALRTEMGATLDLRSWLDLVAVGTIADLAPLTGDNRRLVRAGLRLLGSARARPSLRAMRQAAKLPESDRLTARDVAFRLSPRLNAPGRLGMADLTLRFLMAKSASEAASLLGDIESKNDHRKALTDAATAEAHAQVAEVYGDGPTHGIVVASADWHRGVVGIVAARLVDRFGVPAAVVAFDGGRGHGSVRTAGDFDVHRALAACASSLGAWGGHRAAAGLSVTKQAFDAFRTGFADASPAGSFDTSGDRLVDVELGGPFRVPPLRDLTRLGPFGEGFPAPTFQMDAHVAECRPVGQGGVHAKLEVQVGQDRLRAFAPGMYPRVAGKTELRLVGEIQPDHWRGGNAVELLVRDVID